MSKSNLIYPIYKLPNKYKQVDKIRHLPSYLKWWLLQRSKQNPSEILEGNDFTLENSARRRFKKFEIYGKTEQAQYSGKNKANAEEYTTIASSQRSINIQCEIEAGSYILSLESWVSDGEETYSALEVRNNERALFYGEIGSNKLSLPFTISENATYVRIYSQRSYNTSVNVTTTISKLMVRLSTISDETYEPYVRAEYQALIKYILKSYTM